MVDKTFCTIDEQIELLKRRGVSVDESDRIVLMREGYYSVVNGYKTPFIDRQATSEAQDDRYCPGTTFKQIYALFCVDRQLKNVVFPFLVKAETTFRTALAYSYSNRYRGHDSYLDAANYCLRNQYHSRSDYDNDKSRLLRVLRAAHDNRVGHPPIAHYLRVYGHVPLWVLVNVLTFGNISHMYALSQMSVRNDVCRMIETALGSDRIGADRLRKAVSTLVDYRNVCAHDDRLYCARKGRHSDKSFAYMLDSIDLLVGRDEMRQLRRKAADVVAGLDDDNGIRRVVLDSMQVLIDDGVLRSSL